MNRDTCAHEWQEGGPRDHGRYHCARCQMPLYPLTEMANRDNEIVSLRSRLAEVEKERDALRAKLETAREALKYALTCHLRLPGDVNQKLLAALEDET